jgi:hypothetical protein
MLLRKNLRERIGNTGQDCEKGRNTLFLQMVNSGAGGGTAGDFDAVARCERRGGQRG